MAESVEKSLTRRLRQFPGISEAQYAGGRIAINFAENLEGEIAAILWSRVAERFGLRQSRQGWAVSEAQCGPCTRAVYYASDYFSSPDYVAARDGSRKIRGRNLYHQLCRVYLAIQLRIERESGLPINIWADGLRVLGSEPITRQQFVERTILPSRASRVVLRDLSMLGCIGLTNGVYLGIMQLTRLRSKGRLKAGDEGVAHGVRIFHWMLDSEMPPSSSLHRPERLPWMMPAERPWLPR